MVSGTFEKTSQKRCFSAREKHVFFQSFLLKKTTYLFYVYSKTCGRGTRSPNIMLLGYYI